MSISYTKRGWTNNSPPAINAANLGAMDDALKLTADTVDAATATPTANAIPKADGSGKLDSWVSNASASTKGKVQLAVASELVTGTDDTKAPTAKQLKDATALDNFWLTKRTRMPDGATAVYSQDAWATIDGWDWFNGGLTGDTRSVSGGEIKVTAGTAGLKTLYKTSIINASKGAVIIARIHASHAGILFKVVDENYNIYASFTTPPDTNYFILTARLPLSMLFFMLGGSLTEGQWFAIDWIWIGNYSYLAGSLSEEAARVVNQLGDTARVGAKATTTLTSNGTNVSDGNTVTLSGKAYTFKTALTPAEGEVLIGDTYTDSLDNLVAAVTGGAGNGTLYSCAAAHPLVTASRNGAVVTITALQAGILGNQIITSKVATTLTLANPSGGTTTLAGGVDDWGAKAKAQLGAALGAGASVGALPNRNNSNVIGYFDVVDCASGAQVTLPAGGTWAWMVETYGATYGGAKCGTAAGGAAISGTASANLTMYYERIA